MAITKVKTVVDKEWVNTPSKWGVSNYGTELFVNVSQEFFDKHYNKNELVSLDVEDNEKGAFVGLGICDGKSCFYWSKLPFWLNKYL